MEKKSTFEDQQIAEDVLTSQKFAIGLYNTFAMEATCPDLHQDFIELLTQEHKMQNEIFKLMETKGWYPTEMAKSEKIEKAKKMFTQ